ncbi:MAG: FG-GAP-like repeat-containing protein [Cyclobacteriaceae bacterium]
MKFIGINILLILVLQAEAQISFEEVQQAAGISDQRFNYGCYLGDYNNDGFDDLFITRRTGEVGNSLYRNNGNGTFTEVSSILSNTSKHSSTAVWFDYNNDGWQDLMIANNVQEGHVLLRNNRDHTFSDVTESAGVGGVKKETKSVNAADLNNDGWLDLYLNNFGEDNELYINNQDGSFTESVKIAGANHKGRAMGVVIFDYDNDTDQDIFLTFDGQPFVLYENNGLAQFIDVSLRTKTNLTGFGMGVDIADINHDGFMDLYITNLKENFLIVSNGDLTFTENAVAAGAADIGMGWGCNFVDVNNDGYPEIYVTNEYGFSPEENVLYINSGDQKFQRLEQESIESPYSGFGSAISDFNHDGKQDIFISNSNYGHQILQNKSLTGNWVKIKLLDKTSNWHAIGAKVQLSTDTGELYDQSTAGSGHASQSSNVFHFGLNESTSAKNIVITWPDGAKQNIDKLEANEMYLVVKGQNTVVFEAENYQSHFAQIPLSKPLTFDLRANRETRLYPNPANDVITTRTSQANLTLVDNAGKGININSVNESHTIFNVSTLPEGIYYLKVDNQWERLLIQR